MTSVSFRCDQLDLRALCFYAAVLLSLLSRSRACCQCLLGERRRLCCPECESPLGRERGSGSRPVNGQRGLLGSSMLSGSSPLPHRVSAHCDARREFFKRIRDSLHCVRRTLQRRNQYYWQRSSARRSITPNTASSAQARRKSNAKQRQDKTSPFRLSSMWQW